MDKQLIANTLKGLKESSPKRNFKQSIDLVINLKGLDLKKTEHQVNTFVTMHYDTGKKISVCALVGSELQTKAKEVCDEVIAADQFDKLNKKGIKKLAKRHNFFIAQASAMPKVATIFGKFLGPRGKMPNPKMGAILSPNANVKAVCDKLKKTLVLAAKAESTIKCSVGREDSEEGELIDNILMVYNSVIHALPNEQHNIKSVMLKYTMSPPIIVGEKQKAAPGKIKSKEPRPEKPKEPAKKEKTETKKETKKAIGEQPLKKEPIGDVTGKKRNQ